jgi:hypothetical protein
MAQASGIQTSRQRGERKVLASEEEFLQAIIEITGSATRGLAIMTPDLEPDIYAHDYFLDALKRFVLATSFARVRVLITEPHRAMKSGNQFVLMGARLNSYIEFRNLKEEFRPRTEAYCIADDAAIVYRARYDHWEGMVDTHAPAVAQSYLKSFDELWQAC